MEKLNYYQYDYTPKFRTLLSERNDPVEVVADWAHSSFSDALNKTNDKFQIKGMASRINNKNQFTELLTDKEWSSFFKEICYEIFIHKVLVRKISSGISGGLYRKRYIEDRMKEILDSTLIKCDNLYSELTEQINLLEIDEDIKEFHHTYAEVCGKQTQEAVWDSQSDILEEMAFAGPNKKPNNMYTAEKIIRSNEEGY